MDIFFAPMEGITDGVFRRIHRERFGGKRFVVEIGSIDCAPLHEESDGLCRVHRGASAYSDDEIR